MSAIKRLRPVEPVEEKQATLPLHPKTKAASKQPLEMRQRMHDLVSRVWEEENSPEAVTAFEEFVTSHPEIIRGVHLVSFSVENDLMALITCKDAATETFLRQEISEMREGLGYEGATEIERMMIDRVVLCWARVQYAEAKLTALYMRECAFRELEFAERALLLAHTRHIRAVEAFARLSKLARGRRPTDWQTRAVAEMGRRRKERAKAD